MDALTFLLTSSGDCKLNYDDVMQILEKSGDGTSEANGNNKIVSVTHRMPLTLGKKTNYKAFLELQLTISRGYLSTV